MSSVLSLKPRKGVVLAELKKQDSEKNGILLPDSARKIEGLVTIIAVHPSSSLKAGEKVIIEELDEDKIIEENGNKYILLSESIIAAVVED